MAVSSKPKMNVVLLCCLGFLGIAGIHRFYVGRPWTGLFWLFTCGICGIGTIIDLIMIGTDRFKDAEENIIKVE